MEQHTYPDGVAGAPVAARQGPQSPPTMPVPQAGPQPMSPPGTPAPQVPGLPVKKKWWNLPKVLLAAGIAVLLAGGGGAAIGYTMGKTDATHQFAQRFQNGRPNGANGQRRHVPFQGQPSAPSTPDGGTDP